ncbi:MAG: nuclear transport factor 2 family protein [Planctomycetota bacterium]|nr:nuclear transport factor 2 family protein [Planctomycetota bacterium]
MPASPAMTVGTKLVDFCKKGEFKKAIQSLYAKDIVSTEASCPEGQSPTAKGIEACLGKADWWAENHTVHSMKVEGPFPNGDDRFCVYFEFEVTPKVGPMANKRFTMKEVGLYTVKGEKVSDEAFFYAMG